MNIAGIRATIRAVAEIGPRDAERFSRGLQFSAERRPPVPARKAMAWLKLS